MITLEILATLLIHFLFKCWENVLFKLRSERANAFSAPVPREGDFRSDGAKIRAIRPFRSRGHSNTPRAGVGNGACQIRANRKGMSFYQLLTNLEWYFHVPKLRIRPNPE